jgi:hypothetical protein
LPHAGIRTGASVFDHQLVGNTQLQNKIVTIMAPMVKLICMDKWKHIIHVIFKGFDDWIVGLKGNVVCDPLVATWLWDSEHDDTNVFVFAFPLVKMSLQVHVHVQG